MEIAKFDSEFSAESNISVQNAEYDSNLSLNYVEKKKINLPITSTDFSRNFELLEKENNSKVESTCLSSSNSTSDSSSSSSDEEENKCSSSSFFTAASEEARRQQHFEKGYINVLFATQMCQEDKQEINFDQPANLEVENLKGNINFTANSNLEDSPVKSIDLVTKLVDSYSIKSVKVQHEKLFTDLNLNKPTSSTFLLESGVDKLLEELKVENSEDNFEVIEQGRVQLNLNDSTLLNNLEDSTKSSDNSVMTFAEPNISNFNPNNIFITSSSKITSTKLSETTKIKNHNLSDVSCSGKKRFEKEFQKHQNILDKNVKNNILLSNRTEEDFEKIEAEMLQKMREEEETAVMNLTDLDCFGTNYSNSISTNFAEKVSKPSASLKKLDFQKV